MNVNYVLTDVFMGMGHHGLTELIEKHARKNTQFKRAMEEGGLVLFINKARTRVKLFGFGGAVLGYLKVPAGRKLSLETIDLIPRTFGGSLSYGRAVRNAFAEFVKTQASVTEIRASA